MLFNCNLSEYEHGLREVLRMFAKHPLPEIYLNYTAEEQNGGAGRCEIKIGEKVYEYAILTDETSIGEFKKAIKKRLYLALKDYLGQGLPWGSLTGIRPIKIAHKYLSQGGRPEGIDKMLQDEYYVSPQKARLTAEIVQNQTEYLQKSIFDKSGKDAFTHRQKFFKNADSVDPLSDCVNLYVHIPFCPSRCSYCSFVSLPREKNEGLLDNYLQLLCRDIIQTRQLIKKQNKRLLSIYIGGGTPTVLCEKELEKLLAAVCCGDMSDVIEFTTEAGRPDTITEDKLRILKRFCVTRVCVNPQSFSEKTLKGIGRAHTAQSVFDAFDLCRRFGFDINMDLIAGLPNESLDDFRHSLFSAVSLLPENITVHTLSLKKGSKYAQAGESLVRNSENAEKMIDLAYDTLKKANYAPYYLYRQKEMVQSLENTGYCLKDKQSVNNITVMEETVAVYACGAGAISKRIVGGTIKRLAELRDVGLYITEFEQRLQQKLQFLDGND